MVDSTSLTQRSVESRRLVGVGLPGRLDQEEADEHHHHAATDPADPTHHHEVAVLDRADASPVEVVLERTSGGADEEVDADPDDHQTERARSASVHRCAT